MKIAIVGGHMTPALAVIDAFPKNTEFLFIGRKFAFEGESIPSLEFETVTRKGIEFFPLTTGRMQRTFTKHTISSLAKVPFGLYQSLQILRSQQPDAVLAFGGYLSVPVGVAASLLKIPLVIHEQTLAAGLANKVLARFASAICISWQQSAQFFPKEKTVLTGNPVREFDRSKFDIPISSEHKPLIYITGGSAGAHAINMFVEGCLANLLEKTRIIHQTGDAQEYHDYERLQKVKSLLPQKLQERYYVTKFIDPYAVGTIMEKADVIISRSGMNTTTEILHFGKPSLLIPLPYGQRNEQLTNAQFVKKTGIGEYIVQQETNTHTFLSKVEQILENRTKYLAYANDARSLIYADAADRIKNVVYETISISPRHGGA